MSHKRTKSNSNPQRSSSQLRSILDVAVLTAGRIDLFEKCLDAVQSEVSHLGSKVYVCENGVPIEQQLQYDQIYKKYDNIKLLRLKNNLGYPGGANKAIYAGMAPLCLFVTDDIILHKGAVDTLIRRMDDPKIALCGLKLLFPPDSTDPTRPAGRVQHVGHAMNIRGEIYHPFMAWTADNPKCCVSRQVISVTGATFMVRRNAWNHAKGFFEGYGMGYFEDTDLCFTLGKLGYQVWVDADAIADHYVGATFSQKKENQPNMQMNYQTFAMRHQADFIWTEYQML